MEEGRLRRHLNPSSSYQLTQLFLPAARLALRAEPSFYEEGSYGGLTQRLLHAMMTNGEFKVVLAGHSAAAGHGNNFNQSSIIQVRMDKSEGSASFVASLIA